MLLFDFGGRVYPPHDKTKRFEILLNTVILHCFYLSRLVFSSDPLSPRILKIDLYSFLMWLLSSLSIS